MMILRSELHARPKYDSYQKSLSRLGPGWGRFTSTGYNGGWDKARGWMSLLYLRMRRRRWELLKARAQTGLIWKREWGGGWWRAT